jgi:hypothetical protein
MPWMFDRRTEMFEGKDLFLNRPGKFSGLDEGVVNQNDILFFILIDGSDRFADKKSIFFDVGELVPRISINSRQGMKLA